MTDSSKSIELALVTTSDYKELIKYLSNFEGEDRGSEFWRARLRLWWDDNPAFSNRIERGWILKRTDNGKIVGFIGNIPSFFQFSGNIIIAFNSTTWRVSRQYRNHSIYLVNSFWIKYASNTILFSTTNSDDVIKIIRALNFRQFPFSTTYVYYTFVKPYNVLSSMINEGNFILTLEKPLSLFLKLYQFIRLISINKTNNVKRIFKADFQFDALWEKTKDIYPNTNIRTSEVLNWYCFENPVFEKILFGYFNNGKLQAYCIFKKENKKGLRKLICLDLWGYKINKKIVKSFVLAANKFAAENNIDLVRYSVFYDKLDNFYHRLGLFRRNIIDRRYFKMSAEKFKVIKDNKTYLTLFHGDYGL